MADEHHFGAAPVDAVICPGPRAVCAELLLAEGRHAEAARLPAAVGDWLDMRDRRNPAWCPGRLRPASALAPVAPEEAVGHAEEAVSRARESGAA
ncbi:hypothetical protein [Streptomyces sp. NPDC086519]|uniref:hypothetical protein n=1 Tax=Streptomyces sp. NPDC086519 TaxID=3154863 RepID=UPI00343615F3